MRHDASQKPPTDQIADQTTRRSDANAFPRGLRLKNRHLIRHL